MKEEMYLLKIFPSGKRGLLSFLKGNFKSCFPIPKLTRALHLYQNSLCSRFCYIVEQATLRTKG